MDNPGQVAGDQALLRCNPPSSALANAEVAGRLQEVASVLAAQGANRYRVAAYRRAARIVRGMPVSIPEIAAREGVRGLLPLPGIGERIARSIVQLVTLGRLPMLDRLRGESDPVTLLASVPGIGRLTAARVHDELGIHTLEELELAAHDGRLRKLGLGEKRLAGIRDSLAGRLGRIGRRSPVDQVVSPRVAELLDVDLEYRSQAAKGALVKIAPRRFNPRQEAWLPVLHTTRGRRHYTALYSNTARAHELGQTHDWVVLYYDGQGPASEGQCTIVTARRGPMNGRRVVRGREEECLDHYAMR